jgi:hypothetical protein
MKLVRWILKWLAMIGGALALVFLVRTQGAALSRLVASVLPHLRRGWHPIVGDPTRVSVDADDGPLIVKLPEGVTSDKVEAVGASANGWEVQVAHAPRDRRSALSGE